MSVIGNLRAGLVLAAVLSLTSGGFRSFGVLPPDRPGLPDFDRRSETNPPALDHRAAVTALRARLPDAKIEFDPLLGSPHWISSARGFLTGPNASGLAVSPATLSRFSAADPHRATRAFLDEHRLLFGHGSEVLDAAPIKRDFTAPQSGLRTVVWEQQVNGIPVFEALLISHTSRSNALVALSSHFVPSAEAAADAGTPNRAALLSNPAVSASQALILAMKNLGETLSAGDINPPSPAQGPDKHQSFSAHGLKGNADARLVWLPWNRNSLRLCWDVILMSRARGEMFRLLIDARSGEPLLRRCLTESLDDASYRIFTTPGPTPFTLGFPTNTGGAFTVTGLPTPATNQPPQVDRVLVVTTAFDTNASPDGWIDDTNNETLGNNVDAHTDRNADNLPDLPRPRGSPFRVFDPPFDLTQDPSTYGDACVVNVFYWCNWMHDRLYQLGFTEAAGNFQTDNFGRGGLDNDPVLADAQDGSGYNNANFSTPPDGASGRMQLYIWNGPTPNRDGDFDTEVILHEYTHGLSNRRVGGGVGISALQSRGLGEGWSDFYSLTLLSQPADDLNGTYPEGPYVAFDYSGLTQNYYYGVRRFPYTTDTNRNPETFQDIQNGVTHHGLAFNPAIADVPNEIHNVGEVWCEALWDARANLINKYGFAAGTQLILQLATDGMNLTPANPDFLQARDGILLADLVDNGGVNYHELWLAFAKRGMGYFAVAPPNTTTTGLTEDFSVPDDLLVTPPADLAASGPLYGQYTPSLQSYSLYNTGTNDMNWSATASVPWVNLSTAGGILTASGGVTNLVVSLNAAATNLPIGSYSGTLTFSNLNNGLSQAHNLSVTISAPRIYSFPLDTDPGWSRSGEWAFGPPLGGGGSAHGNPDPSSAATGANVFGVNLAGDYSLAVGGPYYLVAGPFDFTGSSGVTLQFQRWLNFDTLPYASATIDVSSDGTNWVSVFVNGSQEFADSAWTSVSYNISAVADNQSTVYVRWGYSIFYGAFAYSGWNLDDIQFLGFSDLHLALPVSATEGDGVLPGQGRLSLSHPAPVDLTVALASTDTSKITVPASVTVPAGQTNASFDLTIIDNLILDGTKIVGITAAAPGFLAASNSMMVFDNETATLSVSLPAAATEGDFPFQGTISINSPPADDAFVTLTSSDPSSLQVIPATVFIQAGQTSAFFFASVVDDHKINGDRQVTVTAHVANWTDGQATITIHDNENTNLTLTLPLQARENNGLLPGAGLVSISGTLTNDLLVSLVSSNTAKLLVPATVTIPAGQTSAPFNLTAVSGNPPQSPVLVAVSASAVGFVGASASMTVTDSQTPPAPFLPSPPDLSTTNPVFVTLAWQPGLGEGVEQVVNGGFESGDFSGWSNGPGTNSAFIINNGTVFPISGDSPTPVFDGNYFASAEQSAPSVSILQQDLSLPAGPGVIMFAWADRIANFNFAFDTNQQFTVEIRDTNDTTLATIFSTKPGDPSFTDWTRHVADLSAWAGQTIRLAFVVNTGLSFLDVHLDDVSVRFANVPATTYDVYFGTDAIPTVADLLGSTINTCWPLPRLAPFTNYFWQIVARRANQTPGPVWQFSSLPTFTVTNLSLLEDNSSPTNAVFTVTLSDPSPDSITLDFATADGSAVAPGDYSTTNGTLVFDPGVTNLTITVPVNGNLSPETNEIFFLTLSNPVNAALATNQAVATILNDDILLQPVQLSGSQVTLTWNAISGNSYRVQYKTNLSDDWTDLPGDILATGPTASAVDNSGLQTQRFYHVILLP